MTTREDIERELEAVTLRDALAEMFGSMKGDWRLATMEAKLDAAMRLPAMAAIAEKVAIGEVVMRRAEALHEPPGCKWHDHGPEMHIEDTEMRDAALDAALALEDRP